MSPIYNGGKGTLKEDAKITIIGAKTAKPTSYAPFTWKIIHKTALLNCKISAQSTNSIGLSGLNGATK